VIGRLVESWLDSASERSYQGPFCQILNANGYTVVHSTRHAPIEFGKDVIAIAPDGVPCAFQLKGNPSKSLRKVDYDDMLPQLLQLVEHPIVYAGVPEVAHRSFLVTNGQVEEEVQRAIDDLNRGLSRRGHANGIEIWSRGRILRMAVEQGEALWPSELEDVNVLLELLIDPGNGSFPIDKLTRLLEPMLGLRDRPLSRTELARAVPSAAVLTGVALRRFAAAGNHWAAIAAWVAFVASAIGAATRAGSDCSERAVSRAIEIARGSILDELSFLADEVIERKHLIEGDGMTDLVAIRARTTLLRALMSVYWFWRDEIGWRHDSERRGVEAFLEQPGPHFVWGEAAIPQVLAYWFWKRRTTATIQTDFELAAFVTFVARANLRADKPGLPNPYRDYEEVGIRRTFGSESDRDEPEDGGGSSYFCEGLFHLVVRTWLKLPSKLLWPLVTRVSVTEFAPEEPWQYCLWRSTRGRNVLRSIPPEGVWNELVEQVRHVSVPNAPKFLMAPANRHLLMLFLLYYPHRGSSALIRRLGWFFNDSWFPPPAIDD
jgi:hypothetical protein